MDMTPLAASTFTRLMERATGQELVAGRRWRIETALGPVLRSHNMASLDQLAVRLNRADEARLQQDVVEALLNHETSFFRDIVAFRALTGDVLTEMASRRASDRRLRIWSAGCATGQESYSLALTIVKDPMRWTGWDVSILGTDLSGQAIARARDGIYSQMEIQRGLPIGDMLAWFNPNGENWQAKPELRRAVTFATHNLMAAPPAGGPYDVVLCRNVLLYFPVETRRQVLDRIAGAMAPDGLLCLGAGETVLGQSEMFEADMQLRGFYRRKA